MPKKSTPWDADHPLSPGDATRLLNRVRTIEVRHPPRSRFSPAPSSTGNSRPGPALVHGHPKWLGLGLELCLS